MVKNSQKYNYFIREHTNKTCALEFYENNELVGVSEFSEKDAELAGLLTGPNKDTYKKYPRNMYFYRAMSNGVKWYCPDISSGISMYTPDEIETLEVEISEPEVKQLPSISNNEGAIIRYMNSIEGSPKEKMDAVNEQLREGNLSWSSDVTIKDIVAWGI